MSVKQLRCTSSFVRVRLTRSRAIYLINADHLYYAFNVRKARVDCISKTLVFYSSYKVSLFLIIFSFSVPYDSRKIQLICPSYSAGNKPNHHVNQFRYKETKESAGHSSDPGLATSCLNWESWFPYFSLTCHFIIEKLEWTVLLVNRTTIFVHARCMLVKLD